MNFNIEFITLGGHFFWDTIERKNGWKIQENNITGHYRILNPDNIRIAWGWDKHEIKQYFNSLFSNYDDKKLESEIQLLISQNENHKKLKDM